MNMGTNSSNMATGSIESFDSGVSLKSDQSKPEPTDFKDRVSPRPDDLIGPDIDPVGDHDDLMAERNRLSIESFDSGVSLKSDWSKLDCLISKTESLPEEEYVVSDDEDLVKSSDDQEAAVSFKSDGSKLYKIYFKKKLSSSVMNEESVCSSDSGVSFKSDQSKGFIIYFNESSPPSSEQQQRPHSAGTIESDQMESRMAVRLSILFGVLLWSYTYCFLPRRATGSLKSSDSDLPNRTHSCNTVAMGLQVSSPSDVPKRRLSSSILMDFDSDVSADLNKPSDDQRAEREAQLHMQRRR
ncbi:hypothetical protein ABVT39_003316 [Epinephelus coioides]